MSCPDEQDGFVVQIDEGDIFGIVMERESSYRHNEC
jgi:hypothetical protein